MITYCKTRLRVQGGSLTLGADGFGRCNFYQRYNILKKEWLAFGVVVWVEEVDREEVPVYAWAGAACYGDTCGWKSKFAPWKVDGIKENAK